MSEGKPTHDYDVAKELRAFANLVEEAKDMPLTADIMRDAANEIEQQRTCFSAILRHVEQMRELLTKVITEEVSDG